MRIYMKNYNDSGKQIKLKYKTILLQMLFSGLSNILLKNYGL